MRSLQGIRIMPTSGGQMNDRPEPAAAGPKAAVQPLTPAQFAAHLEGSWRKLWCIGAAIVGDRVMADDVLQEAAMIALGKLSQFDPRTSFAAWMAQIVRFVALNQARRRQRTAAVPLLGANVESPPPRGQSAEGPAAITSRGTL